MCSLWSALHKVVVKFAAKIFKKRNVDHHDDDLKHSFQKKPLQLAHLSIKNVCCNICNKDFLKKGNDDHHNDDRKIFFQKKFSVATGTV